MSDHLSRAAAVWFWDRILKWVLVRRVRAADKWLRARTSIGLLPRDQDVEDRATADFRDLLGDLPRPHRRACVRTYETLRKECLRSEHSRLLSLSVLRRKV